MGDIKVFGEGIEYAEKIDDIIVLYAKEDKRGEVIGKNGVNIKKLRKEFGKVVVRDV
jgi:transcription antitermination factor NusA-like protein